MAAYYTNQNDELRFSLYCKNPRIPRSERGKCGAKTRRGATCQAPPVWDKSKDEARNGRCKLHGGLSTGPRTEAGKDAIRDSNWNRSKCFKKISMNKSSN